MALARIITRSEACSRELAVVLLARGYAVEIVSPDSIPDNIADLELRVDAGLGDRLIASVEAHDGERSASLQFVHHLKAPMVDFMRRPPEPREALHVSEVPVSFNAEPSIEDVELPAGAPQLEPKTVSPGASVFRAPEFDREEGARLISPPEQLPLPPVETPSHFVVEAVPPLAQPPLIAQPTIARPTMVPPAREPQRPDRSAGWRWRAALTFASVVLLALVLGFGMRRTAKDSAQSSAATAAKNVAAAPTDVNLLSAANPEMDPRKDPGQVAALAVSPPAIKSEGGSGHAPKESPVAKAGTSTASTGISRRHADGLIAPDTVTYLDERYKPAPKAKPANHFAGPHPSSRKHGGVIAANTVTYLNNKSASKAAK